MHKDELLQFHSLLLQFKRYLEGSGLPLAPEFADYERMAISPHHIHKSKTDHKVALFMLGKALSSAVMQGNPDHQARLRERFDRLAIAARLDEGLDPEQASAEVGRSQLPAFALAALGREPWGEHAQAQASGVFVLGPSEWDTENEISTQSPLDWRRWLAAELKRDTADLPTPCQFVVMEDAPQASSTAPGRAFGRIEKDYNIKQYIFVLPKGSKNHGLAFEAGLLYRDHMNDDGKPIALAVQDTAVTCHENGDIEFTDTGRRTRYFLSLVEAAATVILWNDWTQASDNIASWLAKNPF